MAQTPMHIVLKYSDSYYHVDTIMEHQKIMNEHRKVIWGIIRQEINSPAMGEKRVALLNNQISKDIPTYAFISSGSRIKYKGKIEKVYTRDEIKEHINLIPEYYRHEIDKCANGILLSSLKVENHEIIKKLKMYDTNDNEVALHNQTNPIYVAYNDSGSKIGQVAEPETKDSQVEEKKTTNERTIVSSTVVLRHITNFCQSRGFNYSIQDIANFYLSLKAKPFVILAGISGTGKSKLPQLFAEAINASCEIIPVKPDWTDNSDVIGYTNLKREFEKKPLLEILLKAKKEPNRIHFIIFDEMNLARVEYYFSDFLSLMETRRIVEGKFTSSSILRDSEVGEGTADREKLLNLKIPENLYIIGTVNMDETTHPFSKKVLDRANSIEMNQIDLEFKPKTEKVDPLGEVYNDFLLGQRINSSDLTDEEKSKLSTLVKQINRINVILSEADLQFAYRIRDEISFYSLYAEEIKDLLSSEEALDFQILQKILPRIQGSSPRISRVLISLINIFTNSSYDLNSSYEEIQPKLKELIKGNPPYKNSLRKLDFMLRRYSQDGFTSFWL